MPIASPTEAIVFAVNIPAHDPCPGQAAHSISYNSSSVINPLSKAPIPSNTSTIDISFPLYFPGKLLPPYRNIEGLFILAEAINIPGNDLSHPAIVTIPSNLSACITSSTESEITSRETKDALIPSCPIDIPSDTAIVEKISPAEISPLTPFFACSESSGPVKLHGVTSLPAETIPT